MTTISPTHSFTAISGNTPAARQSIGADLGQDDFLRLLTAELSAQDPLDPKKDSEFISQIMQISALEQAQATQADIAALRYEQRLLQANAMLGQEVDFSANEGPLSGQVTEVRMENGIPMLVVSGQSFDFDQLLSIARPAIDSQPLTLDNQEELYA